MSGPSSTGSSRPAGNDRADWANTASGHGRDGAAGVTGLAVLAGMAVLLAAGNGYGKAYSP